MTFTKETGIFILTLFLGAGMLFLLQPMVAKMLLPIYGGTPSVWTVCVLFFQFMLLAAYTYVWILNHRQLARFWRILHTGLCFLSLIALPLFVKPISLEASSPEWTILINLFRQFGIPLFVIGATAPLLQSTYSQTQHANARDPYFLYVASNVGSLAALLSYPLFIERYWGIKQQLYGWHVAYFLYIALLFYLLLGFKPKKTPVEQETSVIPFKEQFYWIFLSFIPCSLMLSVTSYITTDIAATPLFWMLPLTLYLLSFILSFSQKPLISYKFILQLSLPMFAFTLIFFILRDVHFPIALLIGINLVNFLVLALLFHGELARRRPKASNLSLFYMLIAFGGVVAGLFNSLLAPRIFSRIYEYPLVLSLSLWCIPTLRKKIFSFKNECFVTFGALILLLMSRVLMLASFAGMFLDLIIKGLIVFLGLTQKNLQWRFLTFSFLLFALFMPSLQGKILSKARNFYGAKEIILKHHAHVLLSQNTVHGFQIETKSTIKRGGQAYYGATYPVINALKKNNNALDAIILGLGTGLMACQFGEEDRLIMVEIDPQVIEMAQNTKLFTYLQDCKTNIKIVEDDGLLAIKKIKNRRFDVLVMDAFLSDAIPIHLLTLEAFKEYQQKLKAHGVILVNISNRHLRVLPVLTGAGRELGLVVLHKMSKGDAKKGQLTAEWALLTADENLAMHLISKEGWRFVTESEAYVWTNDYSNIIPLIKWRHA